MPYGARSRPHRRFADALPRRDWVCFSTCNIRRLQRTRYLSKPLGTRLARSHRPSYSHSISATTYSMPLRIPTYTAPLADDPPPTANFSAVSVPLTHPTGRTWAFRTLLLAARQGADGGEHQTPGLRDQENLLPKGQRMPEPWRVGTPCVRIPFRAERTAKRGATARKTQSCLPIVAALARVAPGFPAVVAQRRPGAAAAGIRGPLAPRAALGMPRGGANGLWGSGGLPRSRRRAVRTADAPRRRAAQWRSAHET